MHVHLAVNPTADRGRALAAADEIAELVRAAGHEVTRLEASTAAELSALVHGVVAGGAERLVVAGGDGLVHHLLAAVAGTGVVLGLVPVGTGNDFARGLGLPRQREAAVAAALGPWRAIDAISSGGAWAASVVTAGFSGVVNARANRLRWPRGQARYSVATVLELPRLRPYPVVVRAGGQEVTGPCSLVAVANTAHFGGGMAICPGARPDDGVLEVTVVDAVPPATLGRFFPRVFTGRHLSHPAVRTLRGPLVEVEGEGIEVWADGEPMGLLPVRLEAVSGALRVAGWAG
jgi:diacylglycerol kinase (ATP)